MAAKRIEKRHAVRRVAGRLYYVDAQGNVASTPIRGRKKRTVKRCTTTTTTTRRRKAPKRRAKRKTSRTSYVGARASYVGKRKTKKRARTTTGRFKKTTRARTTTRRAAPKRRTTKMTLHQLRRCVAEHIARKKSPKKGQFAKHRKAKNRRSVARHCR